MKKLIYLALFVSLASCQRYFEQQQQQTRLLAVSDTTSATQTAMSQRVATYIKPYHDSLDAGMNAVLIRSTKQIGRAHV